MDCYIVLTFLCLLITQTSCGPVRRGRETKATKAAIQMMQKEIQTTLKHMAESGKLPDTSCTPSDFTSLLGEGLTLAPQNLSTFGCHLQKISAKTQEKLSFRLLNISQVAYDVSLPTQCPDCCSVPSFTEDTERYLHIKCLLQMMDQMITKTSSS